ncbi:hypothetical protein AB4Z27_09995 [Cupriavidus sp. KB_39]|uniref:hypothetical protein n=1 Tax=Cupriavidus sp. KB_39 TaxID=3233036 RepID=UPI003F92D2DB
MDERIARTKTSQDARQLAENALRLGHPELSAQALAHAKVLQAIEEGYTTPAQQAIATALYAYEEEQTRIKGRTFRATRTRSMFARHGALAAAERMVLNRQPSKGFEVLEEAGLRNLSFEAIIDRYPDEFSPVAVGAARARLTGGTRPSLPSEIRATSRTSNKALEIPPRPPELDDEAQAFLDGFYEESNWLQARWLPRYRKVIQDIADAMSRDRPQDIFVTLWKTADNDIAYAGQGMLSFNIVDRMQEEFVQVIRDVHKDSSPENFEQIVGRFERWRSEDRISMVPRLLIARTFAGLHPHQYHTTVDWRIQNQALPWFVDHTNFVIPDTTSWAERTQALVAHLDRLNVFGGEVLIRNIFPWFVVDQLRARVADADFRAGHTPRPSATEANILPALRSIELRHNQVQDALFKLLTAQYGEDRVKTECPTGTGGFADAIAKPLEGGCHLYEIKIGKNAADVVRQAMGQLLEYGFRAGGLEPTKLFAVGEPPLDNATNQYLARLRCDFNLKIEYLQVQVPDEIPSQCVD